MIENYCSLEGMSDEEKRLFLLEYGCKLAAYIQIFLNNITELDSIDYFGYRIGLIHRDKGVGIGELQVPDPWLLIQ